MFLVERMMPSLSVTELPALQHALREASRRVTAGGSLVRYVSSMMFGSEGRWLGLFLAPTADAVRQVTDLAQLPGRQVEDATQVSSTCAWTDLPAMG